MYCKIFHSSNRCMIHLSDPRTKYYTNVFVKNTNFIHYLFLTIFSYNYASNT